MDDSEPGPSCRVTAMVKKVKTSSTSDKQSTAVPSSRVKRERDVESSSSSSSDESIQSTAAIEESPGEIEVTCTTPVELAEVIWTIPGIQSLLQGTVAHADSDEEIQEAHAVSKMKFTTGQSIGQPIIWEARLTNTIVPKECPSRSDWETGWLTAYICPSGMPGDNPQSFSQPAQARFDIRVDGEDPTCSEEMTYSSEIKTWDEFQFRESVHDYNSVVAKLGRVDEILAPSNHFVGSEGQLRIKMNVYHIKSLPFYYSALTRKRRRNRGIFFCNKPPKKFL